MKDFGDLLEHPLNAPARQVESLTDRWPGYCAASSKSVSRIIVSSPGRYQSNPPHEAALFGLLTPQPPPVLLPRPALGILARCAGRVASGQKWVLG